jgi:putative Holliday junction resolvase
MSTDARMLAVDYGEKYVGIAVSDALQLTAQGLPTVSFLNDAQLCTTIKEFLDTWNVTTVIVGYPKNMNGTRGPRAQRVETFVSLLKQTVAIPVVLWDERLTTLAAQRTLIQADVRRVKRKKVIDRMAATLLLQNYLDFTHAQKKR